MADTDQTAPDTAARDPAGHVAVMRKKLRTRAPVRARRHDLLEESADAGFRNTAKTLFDMDLKLADVHADALVRDAALESLEEVTLIFRLAGPAGEEGLFVLDGMLIDALIEQQTLGRVAKSPRLDRPVTRIDAKLAQSFVLAVLAQFEKIYAKDSHTQSYAGYTIKVVEFDRAALSLALTSPSYDILDVTLDMGPGIKTGKARIWYPAGAVDAVAPATIPQTNPFIASLLSNVTAPLNAEIRGLRLPLTDLISLEPGSLIPVDLAMLADVHLCAPGGKSIGTGRLGQLYGDRAVRVTHLAGQPERDASDGSPASAESPMLGEPFNTNATALPAGAPEQDASIPLKALEDAPSLEETIEPLETVPMAMQQP
ncbi:flagellar motor switch protein FliM [Litoreibacter roseus]|uniref:Flagellar motor switch protein FliN-like C-terminal domain-containing protein n=1 Tax=Litoreibacter roseus TaxID=2601869 RepID=A0A6N6JKP5_9RHOB|nr:flagellar motor switch protein FliM [Litoreibacter roseus]GFE66734.1 hypothetical protein KIN_38080 [Litoreibacter roseus]